MLLSSLYLINILICLLDLLDTQVNMLPAEENDVVMASKQQLQKRRAVFGDITNVSLLVNQHFAYLCLLSIVFYYSRFLHMINMTGLFYYIGIQFIYWVSIQ